MVLRFALLFLSLSSPAWAGLSTNLCSYLTSSNRAAEVQNVVDRYAERYDQLLKKMNSDLAQTSPSLETLMRGWLDDVKATQAALFTHAYDSDPVVIEGRSSAFLNWIELVDQFEDLSITLTNLPYSIHASGGRGNRVSPGDMRYSISEQLASLVRSKIISRNRQLLQKSAVAGEAAPLPEPYFLFTKQSLEFRQINELNAQFVYPIGAVDESVQVDGDTKSVVQFSRHDIVHFRVQWNSLQRSLHRSKSTGGKIRLEFLQGLEARLKLKFGDRYDELFDKLWFIQHEAGEGGVDVFDRNNWKFFQKSLARLRSIYFEGKPVSWTYDHEVQYEELIMSEFIERLVNRSVLGDYGDGIKIGETTFRPNQMAVIEDSRFDFQNSLNSTRYKTYLSPAQRPFYDELQRLVNEVVKYFDETRSGV